ncbi:RagB/SusD family nutrient uptake outer membrane protein [Sphingobacterium sp. SYP-B4668]|uniref:RagB/SusD family nutrient uptake outer membrane protein n=1 Tax=Sphingobacterium sp. SYP-B4668 TaxID=2996035 RepID=UPI0022DD75C3|nr:RagB/SusD family nutrient uptake outer membrane protein [Sphingobacterium sp. SYP-B4668]
MKYLHAFGIAMLVLASSCADFLDKKPDIKLVVPKTLADADLLLNDYGTMNGNYPVFGEIGTDDYYLTEQRWGGVSNYEQRMAYIWADEPYMDILQWQRPYKVVYIANQVLDILRKLQDNSEGYRRVRGTAHFYRAFAFHQLTEIYSPAYSATTAGHELGIPLRLTPEVDGKSVRASLEDTYERIVADLGVAVADLPVVEVVRGRPHKASAYAALARVYLDKGDFEQAYRYADSCLVLRPELLDFNNLSVTANFPMTRFNVEVLFPALATGAAPMGAAVALMDTLLYASYSNDDLRKKAFFRPNNNPLNTQYYKGSYDQSNTLFFGITTSEVYLIKAETACRIGKLGEAKDAIDKLLRSRWDKDAVYAPISELDGEQLLRSILDERRKELVFRGRRWADLKRLNLEPRFQTTLKRTIGDKTYTLAPNDLRYAYRISETVLELSGIQQNKR